MADDGPLSEMLEKTPEGQFANWLGGFLYYADGSVSSLKAHPHFKVGTAEQAVEKLTQIRDYFQRIAHEKLKKEVPAWVRELHKLPEPPP